MTATQDPIRLTLACTEFRRSSEPGTWSPGFRAAEVVNVRPRQAQLFRHRARSCIVLAKFFTELPGNRARPILWGTGVLNPFFKRDLLRNLDIRILGGGGPVGAAIAKVPMREFGDPGLFCARGDGPGAPRETTRSWSSPITARWRKGNHRADGRGRDPRLRTWSIRADPPKEVCAEDRLGCACLFRPVCTG